MFTSPAPSLQPRGLPGSWKEAAGERQGRWRCKGSSRLGTPSRWKQHEVRQRRWSRRSERKTNAVGRCYRRHQRVRKAVPAAGSGAGRFLLGIQILFNFFKLFSQVWHLWKEKKIILILYLPNKYYSISLPPLTRDFIRFFSSDKSCSLILLSLVTAHTDTVSGKITTLPVNQTLTSQPLNPVPSCTRRQ